MEILKEWEIRTPGQMSEIVSWAIDSIASIRVIGLYGDLGAGKTTFTQELAKKLGVREHVTSPTFVIEKSYLLTSDISKKTTIPFKKMVHIDAYRLNSPHELEVLGWQELIKCHDNLIVVEWPERVANIMPPHLALRFSMQGEHNRKVIASYA